MEVFAALIVLLIVGQTWHDWRDARRTVAIPAWSRGLALGGLLAVSLTAATSLATAAFQTGISTWNGRLAAHGFWLETLFVMAGMAAIVLALRRRRLGLLLALTGVLLATVALTFIFLA